MKTKYNPPTLRSVTLETIWGADPAPDFSLFDYGNCLDGEDPDDWDAWSAEVRATAIAGGQLYTGSAHLSGIWERFGNDPDETNSEISDYLPQMQDEALEDLLCALPSPVCPDLARQIGEARAHIAAEMSRLYDQQRRQLDAMAETATHA